MFNQLNTFDIVIVGGGITGCTLALAVDYKTKHRLKIGIIEASSMSPFISDLEMPSPSVPPQLFDHRYIALSYGSRLLLEHVELWDLLKQDTMPIHKINISDQGHFSKTSIDRHSLQIEALGYTISLQSMGSILYQKLQSSKNIKLFSSTKLNTMVPIHNQNNNKSWRLHGTQTNETQVNGAQNSSQPVSLSCDLVVAADGQNSTVAQLLKSTVTQHDYQQIALTATITTAHPHKHQAFERFTKTGPFALLPITCPTNTKTENYFSLVWCLNKEQAKHYKECPDALFLKALQQQFGWSLGQFLSVSKRDSYPLILKMVTSKTLDHVVFIGNAAQSLHPVAGQGFNLGLGDAITLATLVSQHLISDLEPSNKRDKATQHEPILFDIDNLLQKYQQQRQQISQSRIQFTSSIVTLFSNNDKTLVYPRQLGLALSRLAPTLLKPIVTQTIGL